MRLPARQPLQALGEESAEESSEDSEDEEAKMEILGQVFRADQGVFLFFLFEYALGFFHYVCLLRLQQQRRSEFSSLHFPK